MGDHKWLFTKILHVQAAHLDADGSGEVDKDEFVNYFVHKIGFPQYIADAMFNDIDKDGDGNLSVMEYTRWKSKHNKPIKLDKFLDKVEKDKNEKKKKPKIKTDADDSKCAQCDVLKKDLNETKKQMKALNSKSTENEKKLSNDSGKIKALNQKIASLI